MGMLGFVSRPPYPKLFEILCKSHFTDFCPKFAQKEWYLYFSYTFMHPDCWRYYLGLSWVPSPQEKFLSQPFRIFWNYLLLEYFFSAKILKNTGIRSDRKFRDDLRWLWNDHFWTEEKIPSSENITTSLLDRYFTRKPTEFIGVPTLCDESKIFSHSFWGITFVLMDLGDFFERIRIQWDHILILSPVNKIVGARENFSTRLADRFHESRFHVKTNHRISS